MRYLLAASLAFIFCAAILTRFQKDDSKKASGPACYYVVVQTVDNDPTGLTKQVRVQGAIFKMDHPITDSGDELSWFRRYFSGNDTNSIVLSINRL